jgi:hypothetical protein
MDANIMNTLPTLMSSQFMGMAMMRENTSFTNIISAFFLFQFIAFIPQLKQLVFTYLQNKFNKIAKPLTDTNKLFQETPSKQIMSKITFVKNQSSKSQQPSNNDIVIDAINFHITNLETSKYLTYMHDYYVTNNEEFEISNDIYCKADVNVSEDVAKSNSTEIMYNLQIYSYSKSLEELKLYIDTLKKKYTYEQNNKLGNRKFFFDEHHISIPRDIDGKVRFSSAPQTMTFKMTHFQTNKSLRNVFGKHLTNVKERVGMFINHPEWYEEKGIPYTLGIMLHGPPGTGKTSLIKAIAKDTKRHIFNIQLYEDTTQSQLRNLFFNESIQVIQPNGKTEVYNIPLDERIYVIEDIDCLTDIVKQRQSTTSPSSTSPNTNTNTNTKVEDVQLTSMTNQMLPPTMSYTSQSVIKSWKQPSSSSGGLHHSSISEDMSFGTKDGANVNEKLNLSFLLNLLDGILETPGRILIITTNEPDKLDKALIRPGRIDIHLEVGFCTIDMIVDMYHHFFTSEVDMDTTTTINTPIEFDVDFDDTKYTHKITPAELNKILLDHIHNPKLAYETICNTIYAS